MYFPGGFDVNRAVELGELVDQAYAQFEAFRKEEAWELPGDYSLKKELKYVRRTGNNIIKGSVFFDLDMRGVHFVGDQNAKDVPIGFIAQRKGNIFLIFRGTMTDLEWFRNFGISLVPYPLPDFGEVHDGFLQIYHLLRMAIKETLDGTDRRSKLFIAGHSLGGALATIALPDIGARMDRKIIALYTYGSPRIGDNAFATAFNRQYGEKSFRIVNTSDMVGLIPPPSPLPGTIGGYFSHVDTPISFTIQADDLVQNHDIKTYLSALRDSRAKMGIFNKLKFWFAQHSVHRMGPAPRDS
jgi:triacylglycerol lipase